MRKIKVITVIGTRPEVIKMAPLIIKFTEYKQFFDHVLVVTGQHRGMLDQMLSFFKISPNYDLDIMIKRQTLTYVTTASLNRLEKIFDNENPDVVFVHGDTTTSFAASIAAYFARIPVAHVEAGLRTWDKYNPYPEEMNRVMIDRVADLLFAPTDIARANLLFEGVNPQNVFITGNTVVDALELISQYPDPYDSWDQLSQSKKLILVEAHRRENIGERMAQICNALIDIAARDDVQIVFPVHLNPAIRDTVFSLLNDIDNVHLLDPQDYISFVFLMKKAHIILTDSGGVQEEAPSFGVPVLIMRDTTERPEAIAANTAIIVGTSTEVIVKNVIKLLDNPDIYSKMSKAVNPFGDGLASNRIIEILKGYFDEQNINGSE